MNLRQSQSLMRSSRRKMKTGLFIGRFQPFHNGHLSVVKKMEKKCDEIIIAIGSAQYGFYPNNPMTAGERVEMITNVLKKELKRPFSIIPIEDINCHPKYVSHVESMVPKFDVVYTGNEIITELFKANHYAVKDTSNGIKISATEIRKMITENKEWKSFVPDGVYDFLKKNRIDERIRRLNNETQNTKNNR